MAKLFRASLLAWAFLAALPALAHAESGIVLKVGDQKGSTQAVMAAAGVLKDLPYRIEWDVFAAAQPLLEALNAGAIDTGGVGDGPFLFAFAAGAPIKVVSVYHGDVHDSVAIVALPSSPIRRAADLKGHIVGTTRGSIGHYLLLKALAQARLTPQDVTLVFLDPGSAKAALESGSIEAWATWDPYVALAVTQDKARVVANGNGLLPGYGFQAASQNAINTKRAALADFLKRLAKARQWIVAHKGEFALAWSKETGLPLAVAQAVIARQNYVTVPIDQKVIGSLANGIAIYRAAGAISGAPDVATAFDKSFNAILVP
ncbi:MAG: ABC transporter substrate-binding protein [Rhizomicrobium sp.]